jgi:hypothetical protein
MDKKAWNEIAKVRVVNFVLDETGSMASCKDATISGFNEYFNSLKADTTWKTLVTLTKFNSQKMETAYHLEDVRNVRPLGHDNYRPDSNTPLYDAIASTIRKTEADIASANDQPAVFCVILTDGEENASREYDIRSIRALIEQKKRDGWKIICLGADVDAWVIGGAIGLNRGDTLSFDKDCISHTFQDLSIATKEYFECGADAKEDFFKGGRGKKSKK